MIQKKQVERLRLHLQRLFCLKVGRTTFRELQNSILNSVDGNRDMAAKLFETLFRGEIPSGLAERDAEPGLKELVDAYCIPCRLSRDVYERGEYIQVITSDAVQQGEAPLFINRIRRIDGEELQFVSDIESSLNVIQHFVSRLNDLNLEGANSKVYGDLKKELSGIKRNLDNVLSKLHAGQT